MAGHERMNSGLYAKAPLRLSLQTVRVARYSAKQQEIQIQPFTLALTSFRSIQLVNETSPELLSIIEIQYGSECSESDIINILRRPSGDYLFSPHDIYRRLVIKSQDV